MLVTKSVRDKKMQMLLICLIISSLLTWADAEAAQRYCGKTLTDIMQIICRSGFNGKPLKRANILNSTIDLDNDSLANDIITLNITHTSKSLNHPNSTYSERSVAVAMPPQTLNHLMAKLLNSKHMAVTQTRRRRLSSSGGIYYECCLNKCTISEMSGYCL